MMTCLHVCVPLSFLRRLRTVSLHVLDSKKAMKYITISMFKNSLLMITFLSDIDKAISKVGIGNYIYVGVCMLSLCGKVYACKTVFVFRMKIVLI